MGVVAALSAAAERLLLLPRGVCWPMMGDTACSLGSAIAAASGEVGASAAMDVTTTLALLGESVTASCCCMSPAGLRGDGLYWSLAPGEPEPAGLPLGRGWLPADSAEPPAGLPHLVGLALLPGAASASGFILMGTTLRRALDACALLVRLLPDSGLLRVPLLRLLQSKKGLGLHIGPALLGFWSWSCSLSLAGTGPGTDRSLEGEAPPCCSCSTALVDAGVAW